MIKTILLIWGTLDLLIYCFMWYDRKDHKYNFKAKLQDLKDSFEREE